MGPCLREAPDPRLGRFCILLDTKLAPLRGNARDLAFRIRNMVISQGVSPKLAVSADCAPPNPPCDITMLRSARTRASPAPARCHCLGAPGPRVGQRFTLCTAMLALGLGYHHSRTSPYRYRHTAEYKETLPTLLHSRPPCCSWLEIPRPPLSSSAERAWIAPGADFFAPKGGGGGGRRPGGGGGGGGCGASAVAVRCGSRRTCGCRRKGQAVFKMWSPCCRCAALPAPLRGRRTHAVRSLSRRQGPQLTVRHECSDSLQSPALALESQGGIACERREYARKAGSSQTGRGAQERGRGEGSKYFIQHSAARSVCWATASAEWSLAVGKQVTWDCRARPGQPWW
jgi:hypothetical protein